MDPKAPVRITPLWIVAAFVTLTETVLGYAVTRVTGGVQLVLTSFVILYAVLVAGLFFLVLWNRPYVFYPPSEYGPTDPAKFITALRSVEAVQQTQQADIASMKFLITHFVTADELRHLTKLANKSEFKYSEGPTKDFFAQEFRRLQGLGLIANNKVGEGVDKILYFKHANVHDYFHITEDGKEYLKQLKAIAND